MKVRVHVLTELPQSLVNAWLQHLRNFDIAHAGVHFQIAVDAPDATIDEIVEALNIDPPLPYQVIKMEED